MSLEGNSSPSVMGTIKKAVPLRLHAYSALLLLGVCTLIPRMLGQVAPAGAQETFRASYAAGWNLVAGPQGTQFNGMQGDLFSLTDGQAGYFPLAPDAGVEAGRGYWAYFPSETVVPVTAGAGAGSLSTLTVPAGWGLIGNPTTRPVRVSGADAAYQYDPVAGYSPLILLPPGHGALVYSASGASISLAAPPDSIVAAAAAPTAALTPAAPPSGNPAQAVDTGAISVLASGFGQTRQGGPITVAAILRNQADAVDLVPVSITVYDASGLVLAAGDTSLHYMNAGDTTGLAHRLTPRGSGAPARVDVQAGSGRAAGIPPPGALTFTQETVVTGRTGPEATAVLSSSYASDLTDVHVNAIVYDAAGAIIGGGATIKRLVPAGDSAGVVATVDVSGTATRVEFYAQLP